MTPREVCRVTWRREEGGDQEEKRGNQEGERTSYPVITSLCSLHSLYPSEMFTELHREEKREERDRGDQDGEEG